MTWVDIPGYYYHYQISEDGQVRRETSNGAYRTIRGHLVTNGSTYRLVRLTVKPKQYKRVLVTSLMRDAFFGGKREGYRLAHRNGSTTDDALCNLMMIRDEDAGRRRINNRRAVEKIDRDGNVMAVYPSVKSAAIKEYIGQKAIIKRAKKRMKTDEFALCGFSFRYAR